MNKFGSGCSMSRFIRWPTGSSKSSSVDPNKSLPVDSKSSHDDSYTIDEMIAQLKKHNSPESLVKELYETIDLQQKLIDKLLDERKQSRHNDDEKTTSKKTQLNKKLEELEYEVYIAQLQLSELREQIAYHTPPVNQEKKVCVDLYSPGGSEIIQNIEDDFMRELLSKLLNKHNTVLSFNLIHAHEQNQLKEPSIVLCPSFSRLGTDVKSVFSSIKDCGKGTVLVIIHYKDERSLTKVKSEQILSEYSHLSAILDMGYFKKGFYDCQLNRNSFEELSTFIFNFAG